MTISFGSPFDNGFKLQQQHFQDIIDVFILTVIFNYICVRVMVDPLKIFWVLTNSTYLGKLKTFSVGRFFFQDTIEMCECERCFL